MLVSVEPSQHKDQFQVASSWTNAFRVVRQQHNNGDSGKNAAWSLLSLPKIRLCNRNMLARKKQIPPLKLAFGATCHYILHLALSSDQVLELQV